MIDDDAKIDVTSCRAISYNFRRCLIEEAPTSCVPFQEQNKKYIQVAKSIDW